MRFFAFAAPARGGALVLILAAALSGNSWAQNQGTEFFQSYETEAQTADGRNTDETDQQLSLIREDPATVNVTIGTIDVAALLDADRLVLDLPRDGKTIDLGDVSTEAAYGNEVTLRTTNNEGVTTSFIVNGSDIVGTIRENGVTYRIVPLGNGRHALVESDFTEIPDHPPGFEEEQLPIGTPPPQSEDMDEHGSLEDTADRIDVIVAYTNQARIAAGNITALITLAEQETNDSFANSGINPRIRIVQSYQTNYTESGNLATDRDRFRIAGDGFMDEIHQRRSNAMADIAILLTATGSGCGIAAAILANPDTAFAVTKQSCATGNFSFGHELGHLFGARHNPEQDGTNEPFQYGHAFCNDPGNWRTVMSYNTNSVCPTRRQWWSNPAVSLGGTPTGDATRRDNARVLNGTAAFVANFRARTSTPCRAEFTQVGARLCISTNVVGARSFANAHVYCMDRRARVASYEDLRYVYVRSALDAAFNPDGRWLGDWTGDDQVLCGNKSITSDGDGDTGNFDGTCNRFDNRGFWCAYDR